MTARYLLAVVLGLICSICALGQQAKTLSNADIRISFEAGRHAPRLDRFEAAFGLSLHNQADEALPPEVEIDGRSVSVEWELKSQTDDKNQFGLVYESAQPHLRLSWIWEVRANFGAIEHFITVQNLTSQQVWLPLIDSLRLKIQYPDEKRIDHFYVEKGADTPSPEGTHLQPISDGYSWTGKSSTYAVPIPGEKREIIPAEFVFDHDGSQAGWYAGLEFSGENSNLPRTRKGCGEHLSGP